MAGTRQGQKKNKKKDDKKVLTKKVTSSSKKFTNPYAPPQQPQWKPQERAQNDINTAYNPAYRDIDRAVQDAENSYEEQVANARSVHQGLMGELRDLPNAMNQYGKISNQLNNVQLGGAQQMDDFGGVNPEAPGEAGAAMNMFNTQGNGAQAALAGMAQRQSNWDTSVKQQGAVDYANRQTNYLEDYEDLLNDLSQQRFDLSKDVGEQLLSRVDALRDQKFNQGLSLSQYGLNEWQLQQQAESSRKLQQLIQDMLAGDGGGGGGGFTGKGNKATVQKGENKGRLESEVAHQEAQEDLAGDTDSADGDGKSGRTRGKKGLHMLSVRIKNLQKELDRINGLPPSAMLDPSTSQRRMEIMEELKTLRTKRKRKKLAKKPSSGGTQGPQSGTTYGPRR